MHCLMSHVFTMVELPHVQGWAVGAQSVHQRFIGVWEHASDAAAGSKERLQYCGFLSE